MAWRRQTEYTNQVCESHQIGGMSWYAQGQGCHPEGPKQTEWMDKEKPYETQQRPTPGKEKPLSAIEAGDRLAGVQLGGKGVRGFGWQWIEREPEACPSSKEGQQHLGLYYQDIKALITSFYSAPVKITHLNILEPANTWRTW